MRRDVLGGLGILSEAFREPLRDRSGCTNVFRLGEKSGCPDLVAFLKRFIREVGFQVGKLLGCQLGFVFLIGIFYEGWEGASPAGVYPFGVLPSCIPFCLAVGLTADTAAREASGHFYGSGAEVDLNLRPTYIALSFLMLKFQGPSQRELFLLHAEVEALQTTLGISYKDAAHRLFMAEVERVQKADLAAKAFGAL